MRYFIGKESSIRPLKLQFQRIELRGSFRLIDYLTFSYIGIIGTLLLFFHRGVPHWPLLVTGHLVAIASLIAFIKFAEKKRSRILTFFRDAYPFFIYTFFFEEINLIVNILFPFWLEPWLIKWDLMIFGNHPTVWLQRIYHPWLTEIMAFSYWSYYILIPLAAFFFYLRKDRTLFHSYVFNLSFTLYTCYFLFLFLCARGPHETLASLHMNPPAAGFFDHFVKAIQARASISGAAFPSSHVAAVWIVLIYMFKFRRKIGWLLTPLILTLSVSVVYMRYHYAVDSIAAVVLIGITYPLARQIEKKFQARARRPDRVKLAYDSSP